MISIDVLWGCQVNTLNRPSTPLQTRRIKRLFFSQGNRESTRKFAPMQLNIMPTRPLLGIIPAHRRGVSVQRFGDSCIDKKMICRIIIQCLSSYKNFGSKDY
ncbi:hypothetical protein VFPPC_15127 [Pochonia chlamydosporia 170]|uniref:Uncharacterized protein n=1 Tax=Pochonia chlamydosporia 170 TaxID=1380566 RepID=A0A179G4I2_METCM|nr:hypothetical protein VFPPC_15127 [Pochonia chlamydosporia 170]OAQ72430.2 hypothetical protein VFPPC_15127 [Pochonia chlamydosporia 170]